MVGKQRKERAPSFSSEELEVLLDEVSLHKVTLFSSFRNNLCNRNKKELWSDIARKMAASGSGTPRSWQDARKKWHDFSSQVKDIQRQLTEANELARQSLELKRAKLELAKQQHALAEAQFNRPSISVPILLPAEDAEQQSHQ